MEMLNWDPYDAFVERDNRLWREEQDCVRCAHCGEPLYCDGYDLRDFDAGYVCEHCLHDFLMKHPDIIYEMMDEANIVPEEGSSDSDNYYVLSDEGVLFSHWVEFFD